MRIEVQSSVEVDAEDGDEGFVLAAVFHGLDRQAEIDPDAVLDPVAIVVDVPFTGTSDSIPKWVVIWITAIEVGMVFNQRTQENPTLQTEQSW